MVKLNYFFKSSFMEKGGRVWNVVSNQNGVWYRSMSTCAGRHRSIELFRTRILSHVSCSPCGKLCHNRLLAWMETV
jgi:hypothetical protein